MFGPSWMKTRFPQSGKNMITDASLVLLARDVHRQTHATTKQQSMIQFGIYIHSILEQHQPWIVLRTKKL